MFSFKDDKKKTFLKFLFPCIFFGVFLYLSKSSINFDSIQLTKYNLKFLINKEIWKQVYGSMASLASPIVFFNMKYDTNLYPELIKTISSNKTALGSFALSEKNNSLHINDVTTSKENYIIYHNYITNMNTLQNQFKTFRSFIVDNHMDSSTFEVFYLDTLVKYIKYLDSAIEVLKLGPNTDNEEVSNILVQLESFRDSLKKYLK